MTKNHKKVLIITYYWPPSGGSGVQRWVKFVKYLRNFGWEPIIYTPSNPEFPEIDEGLINEIPNDIEVLTHTIWEPYHLYKKFVGIDSDARLKTGIVQEKTNPSFTKKLSVWVRGNFFIPDARKFWIKPSIKFLSDYLSKHSVDAIVSNGTPHSLHLIALDLKQRFNIPWLADFRDPWTNIDFFNDLMLTPWANRKHHSLERKVLLNADCVTVTSSGTKKDFHDSYPDSKIEVITNGYDHTDFKDLDVSKDEQFIIAHIGVLMPSRNHPFFWDVLMELINEDADFSQHFKLRLIGSVDQSILEEIEHRNLQSHVEHIPHVPHAHIPEQLSRAHLLLLIIRNAQNQDTILPGKIFEYLATERPVISIGPKGSDSDKILLDTNAGQTFSRGDAQELKAALRKEFERYRNNESSNHTTSNIKEYSREHLTQRLSEVLNDIILD